MNPNNPPQQPQQFNNGQSLSFQQIQQMRATAGITSASNPEPSVMSVGDQLAALRNGTYGKPQAKVTPGPSIRDHIMNYLKGFANIPANIIKTDYGAFQQGKEAVTHGAGLSASGNPVGSLESGLGTAGPAASAVFAPITETNKAILPGEGFLPTVGRSALFGGELGAAASAPTGGVASPLTIPIGGAIGAGFGAAMYGLNKLKEVPQVKDFLTQHPEAERIFEGALTLATVAGGSKATDVLNTPVQDIPGNVAGNVGATAGAVGSAVSNAAGAVASIPGKALNYLKNGPTPASQEEADAQMTDLFNKAIRPTVAGKGSLKQQQDYQDSALNSIKTIAQNKDNLKLVDENNEPVEGHPQTIDQLAQAIDQTKKSVFEKYDALQKQAGEAGAEIDLGDTAANLRKISNDPVVNDLHPEVAKYAANRAEALEGRGTYTPQQAQDAIATLNNSLKAFYKNPSYDTASRAMVDSLVANNLRSSLDDTIENATPELADQPGYQDLKNQYGDLKAIEKDVLHRSTVFGRQNAKGLLDFTDIASGAEAVKGLLNMNPASLVSSAAIKGISTYFKWLNSPNTQISKMFNVADQFNGTGGSSISTTPPAPEPPQPLGESPSPNPTTPPTGGQPNAVGSPGFIRNPLANGESPDVLAKAVEQSTTGMEKQYVEALPNTKFDGSEVLPRKLTDHIVDDVASKFERVFDMPDIGQAVRDTLGGKTFKSLDAIQSAVMKVLKANK